MTINDHMNSGVSRRTITKMSAWSVPVVVAAVAAPAASASQLPEIDLATTIGDIQEVPPITTFDTESNEEVRAFSEFTQPLTATATFTNSSAVILPAGTHFAVTYIGQNVSTRTNREYTPLAGYEVVASSLLASEYTYTGSTAEVVSSTGGSDVIRIVENYTLLRPFLPSESFTVTFRVYTQPVSDSVVNPNGKYWYYTSFRSRIDLGANAGFYAEIDLSNNEDIQDVNWKNNQFVIYYP
ncbi:hypothetical protein [Paenarthrobacter aurescens]|uniref:hypothetical protein n=1 Tax=Paenarthrobacter aurescens TaxID=43663 RepID=UPI00117DECA4|nr:hypothetical protein [Paenarthrobacter aurescens]